MKRNHPSSHRAFTLIELLIVITVLGILAGAILIAINPAEQIAKAKDSAKKTTVSQLTNALQSYHALQGGRYPAATATWIDALVTNGDLKRVPPQVPTGTPSCTIHQNGYCYKTNDDQTEAVVYTLLEASGLGEYNPYFLWSSADNANGIFNSVNENVQITSGFTFGPDSTLTQGLIGWWKMNGDANDSSGKENHGTVTGATPATDKNGQPNKAYNFNGTSGVITVPNFGTQIPSSEITIAAWVNPAVASGNDDLISTDPSEPGAAGNRMNIHFPWDSSIHWQFGKPMQGASVVLSPSWVGIWGHYVFTGSISGNFVRIYRNEVQVVTPGFTNPYDPATQATLRIGGRACCPFQGSIDDMRIYNRALSPKDVKNLFDAGPQ